MATDIWKRRPQYMSVPNYNGDVHATWAGPISTKMYGDGLQDLCLMTHNNLLRIRSSMLRTDPCLEMGTEHWHPSNRQSFNEHYRVKSPDKEKVSWHAPEVMFASYTSLSSASQASDSDNLSVSSTSAPTNFCYLCSTLEEHQRHLLHSRPTRKPAKSRKPRISYIAPPPKVRRKRSEPEVVAEVLYRIVVETGGNPEAGTTANVFLTLHGKMDTSPRTQLKKGRGSSKFCFMRGSTETIYYKGPRLGDLTYITIEHDGLMKKDAWYLDHIVVTNMETDQSWMFVCDNWLSLHHGDYLLKRDIEATDTEKQSRELEVTVITGKKNLAGTDAKVYLTMYGKKGVSPKIHLPDDKHHKKFEKGSEDRFNIQVKDLGTISKIRIEHDGSGMAAGWNLDKVLIQDVHDRSYYYTFQYGGWIARDAGAGHLWRELRPRTKLDKEVHTGKEIRYRVTVRTGDVKYAGTDANVFIQFVGPKGTTKKLQMDDAKDNFERGMVEHFDLRGIDVGALTRIIVSHDNAGPGAGWFLEDVTVRRYLSKEEKMERLKRMRKFHKQGSIAQKKRLAEKMDQMDLNKEKEESDDSSDEESDSDDDTKFSKSKKSDKSRDKSFASEVFDRDGKVIRIPEYEQYYFICRQWLAKDESDGQTKREMAVEKKDTFFKDRE